MRFSLFILCALFTCQSLGQKADSIPPAWLWATGGTLYAGTMLGLNALWYQDFPRSGFHSFNDNQQWMQMDKVGHATTSYHISDVLAKGIHLTGTSRRRSAMMGAGISFFYLTGVEVLDGFSTEWGFSWMDQAANAGGVALFLAQDLGWHEQRIRLKYSYRSSPYADCNPDLLGSNWREEWLKDYNGQTYWLSANPRSFAPQAEWMPRWLNLAFGYGATGMVSARERDHAFCEALDELPIRERRYSFSLDVDVTRIPVRSKALKGFFAVFGIVKIPAPGITYSNSEGMKFCALCF